MFALAPFVSPRMAHAQSAWTGACVQDGVATLTGIECLFKNILNVAVSVVGLGAFAMLILGSFQYLTSQGQPKATEGAQKTISYAIFGLVLALSAWIIINVLSGFTGIDLSVFRIQVSNP